MKKRFSLLLAIVMVIAMVLPMLPMLSVPTVAAEATVGSDVIATITGSDGTVKHTMTSGTFESFSSKAVDGDTVTLYKDITTSGNSNFYGTITFDGNGHKMTYSGGDYAICGWNSTKENWVVSAPADVDTLTVKNLYLVGSGTSSGGFKFYNSNLHLAEGNVMTTTNVVVLTPRSHGKVIISGGIYNHGIGVGGDKTDSNKNPYPSTCDLEITGGIFNAGVTMSGSAANPNQNTATITGGTFNAGLTLNNCVATYENATAYGTVSANNNLTIKSGAVHATSGAGVTSLAAVTKDAPVAEIIVGGTTTPVYYAELSKFNSYKATENTTINILSDIDAGNSKWHFTANSGVTLTIDGDPDNDGVNAKITGHEINNPTLRALGPGKVVFDSVDYVKTTNAFFQVYDGCQLDIVNSHWVAQRGDGFKPSRSVDSVVTISGNSVIEASGSILNPEYLASAVTMNVTGGATLISGGAVVAAHANAPLVTFNLDGGVVLGKFVDTTAKVNLNSGYVSGSTGNATVGSGIVADPTAMVNGVKYDTIDAAFTAAAAATKDAVVHVFKSGNMTKNINPKHAYNVTITGVPTNGVNPVISIASDAIKTNKFRFEGGANYALKNLTIVNANASGCLIQLNHKTLGGDLVIDNCDITSADQWCMINCLAESGVDQTVTIKNSKLIHTAADAKTGRSIIVSGNPTAQKMNLIVNIENSVLVAYQNAIWVNDGSTGQITIEDSVLVGSKNQDVICLDAPANLHASATVKTTSLVVDADSVIAPNSAKKAVAYDANNANISVEIGEKVYATVNGVEYTSYNAAFAAAASSNEDVVIKLLADGVMTWNVSFDKDVNVTIDGGEGKTKITAIDVCNAKEDNFNKFLLKGNATYTLKNLEILNEDGKACLIQLFNGELVIDNCDITSADQYCIINFMASNGSDQKVTIKDSTLKQTAAGDGYGIIMTGNSATSATEPSWAQWMNAIIDIDNSELVAKTAAINVTAGSTAQITIDDSTITGGSKDVIILTNPKFLKGETTTTSCIIDADTVITPASGKKAVAYDATCKDLVINTPYDVLLEIYDADTNELLHSVMRKDFNATMTEQAGSNNLTNKETAAGKNLRIEIVRSFEIDNLDTADGAGRGGYSIGFWANNGKTVTVNGNGHKLTSVRKGGQRSSYFTGNGKVVLNGVYLHNTAGSSVGQYYSGVTVEAIDCTLISDAHMGFYLTSNGTLKLSGNTTLTTNSNAINGATGSANTVIIGENVVVESKSNTLNLSNTGALDITVKGTIKAGEGNNAINLSNANTVVKIDGGTVNGNVKIFAQYVQTSKNPLKFANYHEGTVNVINGAVNGNVTVEAGTINVSGGTVTGDISVKGITITNANEETASYTGTINATGGSIVGAVNVTAGKLTVDGATVKGSVTAAEGTYEMINGTLISGNTTSITVNGVTTHYVNAGESVDLVGAEARLKNNGDNGLRFVNTVSAQLVESLKALATGDLEFHTIVLPKEYIEKYNLSTITHKTLEGIEVVDIVGTDVGVTFDEAGNARISAALVDIKGSHYEWEFVSVVYITYTDANGETVYVYGDNTAEALQARSIKSVAQSALDDIKETQEGDYRYSYNGGYSKYIGYKRHVLEAFAGLPGAEMPEPTQKPTTPPAAPDEPKPEEHKHTYMETVTPPTCYEPGYTTYTCTSCGNSYTGAETAPKHDAITHVAAAAATCTKNGNIEYWFCETCGDAWLDAECLRNTNLKAVVLPSAGHVDANEDYKCDGCSTKMLPEEGTALTIPQALAIGKLFTKDTYTTQKYYITGIVTNVYNTTYGNMYLKDDAGNEICIYGLYTWGNGTSNGTRYDKMEYKPVAGDELTVYTVLGFYNEAQGKNAWMDDVVAHEHEYKAVVTAPTCTMGGYTTHTCSICDGYYTDTETPAAGHTTENGVCDRCGQTIGGDAPAGPSVLATFALGANGSASHADGTPPEGYTKTNNGYTFTIASMSNLYAGARDAKGNSCIKLGSSKAAGSFSFTVADDVDQVVIYVAKYKDNAATVKVNGTATTLTKASNDGQYDVITIDTKTTKTINFEVSSGKRCMINTIEFWG